jgi:hypothetical protein
MDRSKRAAYSSQPRAFAGNAPPIDIAPAAAIPLPKKCLRVTGCFFMVSGTFFYSRFTIYDLPVGLIMIDFRPQHHFSGNIEATLSQNRTMKLSNPRFYDTEMPSAFISYNRERPSALVCERYKPSRCAWLKSLFFSKGAYGIQ